VHRDPIFIRSYNYGRVSDGIRTHDRRDHKTTLIYADYAPGAQEVEWVEAAFAPVRSPALTPSD
jgi:hypothetical protein